MYAALGTSASTLSRFLGRQHDYARRLDACLPLVDAYRHDHPGGGLVKIYHYLRHHLAVPLVSGLSRDRFLHGMIERGRRLRLTAPKVKTTQSGAYRFDNQTRDLMVRRPDQLYVSDTTYYRMNSGLWHYITFVVDVYTRHILGYAVSADLKAAANTQALDMAIATRGAAHLRGQSRGVIFHSDGGRQFLDGEFLACLKTIAGSSSMGFVAQENAFAERVNGIIKGEFLAHWSASRRSLNKLELCVARAVGTYNTTRPHDRLPGRLSPLNFEREYATGLHREYEVLVKSWDHNPYSSPDRFTGTQPHHQTPSMQ